MATPFKPWEHYPSLTAKKLVFLASLIRTTRDHVVSISEPEQGDSPWSVGCRAYDRIRFKLREASATSDWLRVLPEKQALQLTFAVGSVPMKLYRGDPEDLPTRTLVRTFSELRQMRLAFETEGADVRLCIRLAVETDASGRTAAISLMEVDEEGTPRRVYEIPLGAATNVIPMRPAPIDLPAPKFELIKPAQENEIASGADNPDTGTGSNRSI